MNDPCSRIFFREINTISDVWHNLAMFFKAPGLWVVDRVAEYPDWAHFFEIGWCVGGESFAVFFSIMFWYALAMWWLGSR
jgi:hypothetical protein